MKNKDLKRRILEISYKKKLSHIGSCLTAVDIIDEIYTIKKPNEKFVLSSGHAGLALYCVIEKYEVINAEGIFDHHEVHPDRCEECHIDCSSGSLGHGLGIAIGMALADRSKNVYCLISDGEMAEGSISEAMRVRSEQNLWNLKLYINDNGLGAYGKTNIFNMFGDYIDHSHVEYFETNMNGWPEWLQGQRAHYQVMDEVMYKEALECTQ